MSELKVRFIDDTYVEYYNTGNHDLAQVYIKAEADNVIAELQKQVHDYAQGLYVIQAKAEKEARRHKHKRCLAMARWCDVVKELNRYGDQDYMDFAEKWRKRWLAIAEKFKEAK